MNSSSETILDRIISRKREEILQSKQQVSHQQIKEQLSSAPPVRDFLFELKSAVEIGLIAEVKKASPSAGLIRDDFDPVAIAREYQNSGANCISCLTDEHFFQGHLEYLTQIRSAVSVPVMRKDFLIDLYQVDEARVAGADCVLLIAECLNNVELKSLYDRTRELGMHALIEIFEPENIPRVLALDPPMLGINNRNLKTFETTLDHTLQLIPHLPSDLLIVSESGIQTNDDVRRLQKSGVGAILVGESLMRCANISIAVKDLMGFS